MLTELVVPRIGRAWGRAGVAFPIHRGDVPESAAWVLNKEQ